MALTDFFRINLPYGIRKNTENEWFVFNREYMPLGWNTTDHKKSIYEDNVYGELPIYTKYTGVTEAALLKIAHSGSGIQRNDKGEIDTVFLYNDGSNPKNDPSCWNDYFEKIKVLAKFEVKRS